MKLVTLLCLTLLSVQGAQATHLLGGYIQAKTTTGSALTYEITAVVYMNAGNAADQTTSLTVCFGDGSSTGIASRVSQQYLVDKSVIINSYRLSHTYAGPGTYTLTASPSIRTSSVNISSTSGINEQELLTLTTTFSTNPVANQTPTLSIPATGFRVALNQRFVFPLSATDPDGDSLVYGLSKPVTSNMIDLCSHRHLAAYLFPNDVTHQGTFKLNNRTGDLTWDVPAKEGYYSAAITVDEYRNGILISQTTEEIPLIVQDRSGTPAAIPPYEPAIEGTIVTAITTYADSDITLTTFPNPVDDLLQVIIQTSNPMTATIELTDANGRKLHELRFNRAARQHEQLISMDSLAPGVYLLRANVGGRSLIRKIVK